MRFELLPLHMLVATLTGVCRLDELRAASAEYSEALAASAAASVALSQAVDAHDLQRLAIRQPRTPQQQARESTSHLRSRRRRGGR